MRARYRPAPKVHQSEGQVLKTSRLEYAAVVIALLAFLTIGWRGREPTSIAGGDGLAYLALSHSLDHGSYRENFRPNAPLQVKYPPGYPAWLVVVRHAVGEDHAAIRASKLLVVAAALLLLCRVARQLVGGPLALAFLALLALNRDILAFVGTLYSEGPRILLSATALAGFLTRSIGVALVFALGVWLWSGGWRAVVGWAAASAAPEKPSSVNFLSGVGAEHFRILPPAGSGGVTNALRARNIRFVPLWNLPPLAARALLASGRDVRVAARVPAETVLLTLPASGGSGPDACEVLSELVPSLGPQVHGGDP